ncbi:hypothetical protein BT69DRAFT_311896 [Atractiella rhizophila]|nr:hypothetical protein BT69DRAFT_311896 [Atractiella rhizophila]
MPSATQKDGPVPDDTQVASRLPRICVDYLSHDFEEDDVWTSWKAMTRNKNVISNGIRLENASWRTWAKQRGKLGTISPETLNWYVHCPTLSPIPPRMHSASPCGLKRRLLHIQRLTIVLSGKQAQGFGRELAVWASSYSSRTRSCCHPSAGTNKTDPQASIALRRLQPPSFPFEIANFGRC